VSTTITPTLNLKAVVRQTGIKPDTLRAWERRYGLPQPLRSAGHQRLYTPRDVRVIEWLLARQAEGLTIQRAVDLWHQIEGSGHDPLGSPPAAAARPDGADWLSAEGRSLPRLCGDWVSACLAFDEQAASQVLTDAFSLYSPESVCVEVLQGGVARIGQGWYEGTISIQQEHFGTALAMRRLEALIQASPPPTRPGRIVAGCPPEEEHTLGLLLLTFLLRRRGWDVVYLGANVPAEQLEATLAIARPSLVILAAQRLQTAAGLAQMARQVAASGLPLAYGGRIFSLLPALRQRVPGHFLGDRLDEAPGVVAALMGHAPGPAAPLPADAAAIQAREHYRERQPLIEMHVGQALKPSGMNGDVLARANRELAGGIAAALVLGDMQLLGSDMEWLEGLLHNYGLPAGALPQYLRAYEAAARAHLDARGALIVDWLTAVSGTSLAR
jgi:methanogenic corrinoid protein MtbC1